MEEAGAPNGEPKESVRIVDCGLLENVEAAEAAHIECTVPRQRREKQQESKERIMCVRAASRTSYCAVVDLARAPTFRRRRNKTTHYDTSTRSALFSWT